LPQWEIVQQGVDIAQAATASRIADLQLLNDDQNTIKLGVWSHDTFVGGEALYSRRCPVESAGLWADVVPTGRPRAPTTTMRRNPGGTACRRGIRC
jgi:hypothetical protein